MSTEWIQKKRLHWPDKSLENVLKKEGASSLLEAVQKKRISPQVERPPEAREDYEVMKSVIKELEAATKDFDIDFIDEKTREKLRGMKVTTKEEAIFWRDAWLKVLGELGDEDGTHRRV